MKEVKVDSFEVTVKVDDFNEVYFSSSVGSSYDVLKKNGGVKDHNLLLISNYGCVYIKELHCQKIRFTEEKYEIYGVTPFEENPIWSDSKEGLTKELI